MTIEVEPNVGASGVGGLHDSVEFEAVHCRRIAVNVGLKVEVNVVDRDVVVAVDQVQDGVANAVHPRDVQFHRFGAARNRPSSVSDQAVVSFTRVGNAER